MANKTSTSGKRGLRAVSALLGKGVSPWAPAWAVVVGGQAAKSSVCLGPTEERVLRVMARTRSDCDELLAREDYILAAWNEWAVQNGQPSVDSFACWVHEGLASDRSRMRPAEPPPIEGRWIEAAEADIPPTEHGGVRDALVMARARLLRRRARDLQTSTNLTGQDASND